MFKFFEKLINGDPLIHPRQNVCEKNNNKFMFEGFVVFINYMTSLEDGPIFMSSWNGLENTFWISYEIYDFWGLKNGLILTNYDHDESIYLFFMYYYGKGHTH